MDKRTVQELLTRLRRDADHICARFGLEYRVIDAERANVKRRYGICYSDGTIKVRLRHATTGAPLKYSSLISTLCHELAHLRHFNHGARFQTFNAEILEWCRRQAIYRPGPGPRAPIALPVPTSQAQRAPARPAPGPEQLDLFG